MCILGCVGKTGLQSGFRRKIWWEVDLICQKQAYKQLEAIVKVREGAAVSRSHFGS